MKLARDQFGDLYSFINQRSLPYVLFFVLLALLVTPHSSQAQAIDYELTLFGGGTLQAGTPTALSLKIKNISGEARYLQTPENSPESFVQVVAQPVSNLTVLSISDLPTSTLQPGSSAAVTIRVRADQPNQDARLIVKFQAVSLSAEDIATPIDRTFTVITGTPPNRFDYCESFTATYLQFGDGYIQRIDLRDEVASLQVALNGEGASLVEDGKFGSATKAAVQSFQSQKGIGVDGIVGPETRSKLCPSNGGGDPNPPITSARVEILEPANNATFIEGASFSATVKISNTGETPLSFEGANRLVLRVSTPGNSEDVSLSGTLEPDDPPRNVTVDGLVATGDLRAELIAEGFQEFPLPALSSDSVNLQLVGTGQTPSGISVTILDPGFSFVRGDDYPLQVRITNNRDEFFSDVSLTLEGLGVSQQSSNVVDIPASGFEQLPLESVEVVIGQGTESRVGITAVLANADGVIGRSAVRYVNISGLNNAESRQYSYGSTFEQEPHFNFVHCVVVVSSAQPVPSTERCYLSVGEARSSGNVVATLFNSPEQSESLSIVRPEASCEFSFALSGRYRNWVRAAIDSCASARFFNGNEPTSVGAGNADRVVFSGVSGVDLDQGQIAAMDGFIAATADPVEVSTGNFIQPAFDLTFGAAVFGMDIGRFYNSVATFDSYQAIQSADSILGRGWRFSHQITASRNPDGSIEVTNAQGRILLFESNGDGTYTRPDSFYGELTLVAFDRLVISNFDGSQWVFDGNDRVVKIMSPDTQYVDIFYEGDQLERIQSSTGLQYDLDYNDYGHLASVTSSDGRTIEYLYDGEENEGDQFYLETVIDPDGEPMTYTTDALGLITEIRDETNVLVVQNRYDSVRRVEWQINGAGETARFTYDTLNRVTEVKISGEISDGSVRTDTYYYGHDDSGYTVDITDPFGKEVSYLRRDEDGEVEQSKDREGILTQFEYDEFGNVLKAIYPLSGEWVYTYDSDSGRNRITSVTTPWGAVTTYEYDTTTNIPSRIMAPLNNNTTNTIVDGLITKTTDGDGITTSFTYTNERRIKTVTDGVGNVTRFTYDGAGRIAEVVDPMGQKTKMDYDESGRLLEMTDREADTVKWAYDAAGRMTAFNDALTDSDPLKIEYDEQSGLMMRSIDFLGKETAYDYNQFSQLTTMTLPGGAEWEYDNRQLGRVQSANDPLGRESTYSYNDEGQVNQVTSPLPETTVDIEYDNEDRPIQVTDPNGLISKMAYELGTGRMLSQSYAVGTPDEVAYTYTYDDLNRVETVTGPRADETYTFTYTNAGRRKTVKDPRGNVTSFEYDAAGRLQFVILPDGERVEYIYDANNRVIKTESPEDVTVETTYDKEGRITSTRTSQGTTAEFGYNENGALISAQLGDDVPATFDVDSIVLNSATDPNGGVAEYRYDDRYNLTNWFDQKGNKTSYDYDIVDQLERVTDPLGRVMHYDYDDLGRVTLTTDASGRTFSATYDNGSRLEKLEFNDGTSQTYTYDSLNRITAITENPSGETTRYDYDDAGNIIEITEPDGDVIGYAWDLAGNRTQITYPDGTTVDYQYDNRNRLTTATHSIHGETSYTYDTDGRLTRVTFPDTTTRTYTYTGEQLTTFSDAGKTWHLSYDTSGRLQQISGFENWHFDYDDGGQLRTATRDGRTWHYVYDAVGNLTEVNDNNRYGFTTYTHDAANQLTTATNDRVEGEFDHDDAGRLIREEKPDGDEIEYVYDSRGRLETITTTQPTIAALDGGTFYLINIETNRFLDRDHNGNAGQSITPESDEAWVLERQDSGFFTLKNVAGHAYLKAKDAHWHYNVATTNHISDATLWEITQNNDGSFLLRNRAEDRYLDADHYNVDTTASSHTRPDMRWIISPVHPTLDQLDGKTAVLLNPDTDRFLDWDHNGDVDLSRRLKEDTQWVLTQLDDGQFTLTNVLSDLFLHAEDRHHHYNVSSSSAGNSADQWEIIPQDDGSFLLRNLAEDRYLDSDQSRYCYHHYHCTYRYTVDTRSTSHAQDTDWRIILLDRTLLEPLTDSWSRTYTPDGLPHTITQIDPTGTENTWQMTWDRTFGIPQPLGWQTRGWEGTEDVALVHGVGPALTVNNGVADNIELGALGDVIGSLVAVDTQYSPFGQSETAGFGLGYRGELHTGPTISLKAREHRPSLQRFPTTDPIPAGSGAAVTTRYAYAANDPINLADPSGLVATDSDMNFGVGTTSSNPTSSGGGGIMPPLAMINSMALLNPMGEISAEIYQTNSAIVQECLETGTYQGNKLPCSILSIGSDFSPGLGDGKGVYEAFTGEDIYTGDELALWERGLGLVFCTECRQLIRGSSSAISGGKKLLGLSDEVAVLDRCLTNSFSDDTLVTMDDNSMKPISEIVIGDMVLAFDEVTGEVDSYPVTDLIAHIDSIIVELIIDGEQIKTTLDHPFYVLDSAPWLPMGEVSGVWIEASELTIGADVLRANAEIGDVESIKLVSSPQRMYNLTVGTAHTFFVGTKGWLVHNTNPCLELIDSPNWKPVPISEAAGVCRTGCEEVADKIEDMIGGAVYRVEAPDGLPYLGPLSNGIETSWRHHDVVVKDGRVYDAFTGGQGVTIAEFRARFEYGDDLVFNVRP